jgi:hypothetical protein
MADAIEAEDLEHDIPAGDIETQEDQPEAEPPEGDEAEDEVLVSFEGDEESPPSGEAQDSSVIRRLREENRKKDAELKALRAQVQPQPQAIEVGPKPTLQDCDYDEERYDEALLTWNQQKAKAEQADADARKAREAQQEAWNRQLADVESERTKLGARDYDQAAETVQSDLSDLHQALIVRAASTPAAAARMIYALGKHPEKRAELAKIEDPVKAIAWLVSTEGKLTVTTQRKAPAPEQIVRGSAPLSPGRDKQLERLEAEAERTGDRTKVVQYKRQQREKARS